MKVSEAIELLKSVDQDIEVKLDFKSKKSSPRGCERPRGGRCSTQKETRIGDQ